MVSHASLGCIGPTIPFSPWSCRRRVMGRYRVRTVRIVYGDSLCCDMTKNSQWTRNGQPAQRHSRWCEKSSRARWQRTDLTRKKKVKQNYLFSVFFPSIARIGAQPFRRALLSFAFLFDSCTLRGTAHGPSSCCHGVCLWMSFNLTKAYVLHHMLLVSRLSHLSHAPGVDKRDKEGHIKFRRTNDWRITEKGEMKSNASLNLNIAIALHDSARKNSLFRNVQTKATRCVRISCIS